MIDANGWRKKGRAVTVLADICRLHVRGAFARSVEAVVTTEAVTGDIGMVEYGWYPCG